MTDSKSTALPSLSAVSEARSLVTNYRLFAAHNELVPFPLPTEGQRDAYRVLVDLGLLIPSSYQWRNHSKKVLELSDSALDDIFADYLDKIFRVNEKNIMAGARVRPLAPAAR